MDYPASVLQALIKIEMLLINRANPDATMELIAEFVFCEKPTDIDSRNPFSQTGSLTLIQEFQLVVVLCEFFARPGPNATRNAVFLSLFGGSIPSRNNVLVKLISTSISASIAPLLCAAGTWMQQLGCTSPPSLELVKCLVLDFVIFSKNSSEQLKSLPMVAPRFAANFMTAVADLYLNDAKGQLTPPPDMLLDVFTDWVSENPSLCLSSQSPLSLPTGAIAMPVITPFAGLIRWCVLSTICDIKNSYSKLHLAILQSLMQTPPSVGPPTAINAHDLAVIVGPLKSKADQLLADKKNPDEDEYMQTSLERFAQSIQVALASRCIYGSIPQLICKLEVLPRNVLLDIVIKTNKSI